MPEIADQTARVRLNRTLVLVGLMGAGKTSVGRRLAAAIDVPFLDSDAEIEAAHGLEIREIFETFGEPYFRDGEARVIRRLLDGPPAVLATGGGAFMADALRADIQARALTIWLDADLPTLWARVKDRPTRPLLQQPEPRNVLARLLEERSPVYAEAALRVPSDPGQSHEVMMRRILEAVRAWDLAHPADPPTLEKIEP
ncbi:MAG: shikimate kinase [Pseudomonadota bacterium]